MFMLSSLVVVSAIIIPSFAQVRQDSQSVSRKIVPDKQNYGIVNKTPWISPSCDLKQEIASKYCSGPRGEIQKVFMYPE